MKAEKNSHNLYPLAIFILALILGLVFIFFFPQFKLSTDAAEYDSLGWNLASGSGYQIEAGIPDLSREPVYPLFLSIIYSIFGHNYLPVRITQAVINALTCVLIFFIGKQALGTKCAVFASFIAAIYPAFIAYAGYILAETLVTFLLALPCLFIIMALKEGRLRWYLLTGFILGIAALCKAVLILFPFFLILAMIFISRTNRRKIVYAFLIAVIYLAVISPWSMRNYRVSHTFIPVRTGSGIGLWGGSYLPWQGEGRGGKGGYPEQRLKYIEEEPLKSLVKGLTPQQADKLLTKEAIKNIKSNPLGYIKLCLKRVTMLWAHPVGEELIALKSKFFARLLLIFHCFVLFFSLIGILIVLRKRREASLFPLLLLIIYFTGMYSITYAHPRYQFPVVPYVILFASFGLSNYLKIKYDS